MVAISREENDFRSYLGSSTDVYLIHLSLLYIVKYNP